MPGDCARPNLEKHWLCLERPSAGGSLHIRNKDNAREQTQKQSAPPGAAPSYKAELPRDTAAAEAKILF